MSNNDDPNFQLNMQRLINAEQSRLITAKIESQTILKDQLARQQPVAGSEMRWQDAERIRSLETGIGVNYAERQKAEAEVAYYKELLSKPLHEIANANDNFKNTYEAQQELLADWMVSQRAFKELAIDFGIKLGMKKEDIVEAGLKNEEKVLSNETEHGNDAKDNPFIKRHAEQLKAKLEQKT